MTDLVQVIRRILRGPARTGEGIVSARSPGEVRLADHQERVLVAGGYSPSIGQRVVWARVDGTTLVTSRYLPRLHHVPTRGGGLRWEQVLVADQVTYGHQVSTPLALWSDSWGNYWCAARPIIPNDPFMLLRGSFFADGWPLVETIDQTDGRSRRSGDMGIGSGP